MVEKGLNNKMMLCSFSNSSLLLFLEDFTLAWQQCFQGSVVFPLVSLPDFSLVSCPLKVVSGVTLQLQGFHGVVTFHRWVTDQAVIALIFPPFKIAQQIDSHPLCALIL